MFSSSHLFGSPVLKFLIELVFWNPKELLCKFIRHIISFPFWVPWNPQQGQPVFVTNCVTFARHSQTKQTNGKHGCLWMSTSSSWKRCHSRYALRIALPLITTCTGYRPSKTSIETVGQLHIAPVVPTYTRRCSFCMLLGAVFSFFIDMTVVLINYCKWYKT